MTPEQRSQLALSLVSGIGPRLTQLLAERFGSAAAILMASQDELETVAGIGAKTAAQLVDAFRKIPVDAEIAEMVRCHTGLLMRQEADFPTLLNALPDVPSLLYRRGEYLPRDARAVGIVGSRQCTAYGTNMAQKIAGGLVRAGYTIVSGLARGIDGAAHEAALAAGGRTVAVLAGGLSSIYPPEHAALAERVAARGVLLSETPMRVAPQRGMFHSRNRLISGLSLAVVIIEANERSGALITARHAAEQDRPVLVVPSNADSEASAGSLRLIRDGARLVRGVDDILEDLKGLRSNYENDLFADIPVPAAGPSSATPPRASPTPPADLDAHSRAIWDCLAEDRNLDDIAALTELPIASLTSLLFNLEMKRAIRRYPGNIYRRA